MVPVRDSTSVEASHEPFKQTKQTPGAGMENHGRDGPVLLPQSPWDRGCALPGVSRFVGLCHRAAGPLPVWGRKAHVRQLSGALLSTRPARTNEGGDAPCRPPHALAASGFEFPALAGRFPPGPALEQGFRDIFRACLKTVSPSCQPKPHLLGVHALACSSDSAPSRVDTKRDFSDTLSVAAAGGPAAVQY
jgi:hypothetical protein